MAPLAAGAHDVEQAVQQASQIRGSRPTSQFRRRDQRFEQAILIIAERLAGPEVPHQRTILGCPHGGLQKGQSLSEQPTSASFAAAQTG
jgi:hypothetical protein